MSDADQLHRLLPICFASLFLLTATAPLPAGTLSLLSSPNQFAHDALIDWTDIGPPSTHVTTPAFFIDVKDTALAARVSESPFPNGDGFRRVQAHLFPGGTIGINSWDSEGFAPGEQLLYSGGDVLNTSQNIGFDFSQPVFGFGVQLEVNRFLQTVPTRIEAFDSDGLSLGFFDVDQTANLYPVIPGVFNDKAAFIGIRSTTREIASVLITPNTNNGVVVSTPLIETGVAPGGPTGGSQSTALMPTDPQPRPEDGAWVFDDVTGTGRWFDPPAASGYEYAVTDGLSNFVSVILPAGIGDADNMFVIEDAVNGSTILAGGASHTFAVPVDAFTVTGIDPTVDGGDPMAFPTFLQFDQLTVSFTQTPIPEPASLVLAVLAGGVMLGRRV